MGANRRQRHKRDDRSSGRGRSSGALPPEILESPLTAEMVAAALIGAATAEIADEEEVNGLISMVVEEACQEAIPQTAVFLRALAAIGTPAQRRMALKGLGDLVAAGVYPPDWAAQLGAPVPVRAISRRDVFGEAETIMVTYRYGDTEHAMAVQAERHRMPVLGAVTITEDPEAMAEIIDKIDRPGVVLVESISLAEARARLLPWLAPDSDAWVEPLSQTSRFSLPVARARLRRLPKGEVAEARMYGEADRAAAMEAFRASQHAADAAGICGADVLDFWAGAFVAYSVECEDQPPISIGPIRLNEVLCWYVPDRYDVTEAQLTGMPVAVLAWTHWVAARCGFDGAAVGALDAACNEVFERARSEIANWR